MNVTNDSALELPDTIEREITINAPVDVVWPLIAEPGWWINEGEIRDHTIEAAGENIWKVTDSTHGEFLIEVVGSTEPRAVSYRWLAGEDDQDDENQLRTLVRFTLEAVDGGTTVRVTESGFTTGTVDQKRHDVYRANTEGWEIELAAARTHLQR